MSRHHGVTHLIALARNALRRASSDDQEKRRWSKLDREKARHRLQRDNEERVLNVEPESRTVCPPETVRILTSQVYNGARKLRSTRPCSREKLNCSDLRLRDSARKVVIRLAPVVIALPAAPVNWRIAKSRKHVRRVRLPVLLFTGKERAH